MGKQASDTILFLWCVVAVGWMVIPHFAHAALQFTEVMYDLPGADADREWVEVHNDGESDVSLDDWRFNDGSNHLLNEPPKNGSTGALAVPAGGYLILADDAEVFLDEHNVSVSVIDTVMSLGQQDDQTYTLRLLDSEGANRAEMSYTTDAGATDGNSLQYKNGQWVAAAPTPGSATAGQAASESTENNTGGEGGATGGLREPVIPSIAAAIDAPTEVLVGADREFIGRAVGTESEPLEGARFLWSFGDGTRKEGEAVLHHFRYPGTYVVALDVSVGKFSASDRVLVHARPAEIALTDAGADYIELTNLADRELNLSHWVLESGGEQYVLPANTFIAAKTSVRFPSEVTGLSPKNKASVVLGYPNGKPVEFTEPHEEADESTEKTPTPTSSPVPLSTKSSQSPPTENTPQTPAKKKDATEPTTSPALAAAGAAESGTPLWPYLLGVLGITVLAGAAALARKDTSSEADKFTIIEESE